jgi:hypothetical protein
VRKEPRGKTHTPVILFPTILHFLSYNDLNYWLQSTSYAQTHGLSSISSEVSSFYPHPHEYFFSWEGHNQVTICLRLFCQPLLITSESNEGQREAGTYPSPFSILVAEIGPQPTKSEPPSKLSFMTAHGNVTVIL